MRCRLVRLDARIDAVAECVTPAGAGCAVVGGTDRNGRRAHRKAATRLALRAFRCALLRYEVNIELPRFTATYASSLINALTSLGMGVAFNRQVADFTGLASRGGVYISDVEHEAVIQVDERGTVAAGATELSVVKQSVAPPSIRMTMNRPFFYAIVDGKTGALLFIGTVIDPTRSSSPAALLSQSAGTPGGE